MAARVKRRSRVLVSRAVPPAARRVVQTYCSGAGVRIVEIPYIAESGQTDLKALEELLDEDTCCVALGQPNYFGVIENMAAARDAAHDIGALLIAVVEPISLGILKPPGEYGADVVVGEGQPLGLVPGLGGPLLGLFACKEELVRYMPGRVVGQTVDGAGRVGYCLTLQAREQHIRRGRATSNICTSQALCALAAAVYLAALGPEGLRETAELSAQKAHYLGSLLTEDAVKCRQRFAGPFLHEFVLQVEEPVDQVIKRLCERGYLLGPALAREYPELADCLLVAVTERRTKAEVAGLAAALSSSA